MPSVARPLTEACSIREGILKAEGTISALAVDLDAILSNKAETAYDSADAFFRLTYPTLALTTIVSQVFRRVTGGDRSANGIYLLGTSLGGGKSHILASLYHMGRTGSDGLPEEFRKALNGGEFPPIRVAVLTQNSPAGRKRRPRTIWGHLATQLDSYDLVQEYDENIQAPPKEDLEAVLGDEPLVILVDEVTNYMIRAAATRIGGTTLAEQTRVFLQILEEVVDLHTNVALVVSQLTEEFDPLDEEVTLKETTKGLRSGEKEAIRERARHETRSAARLLMRKAETQTPVRDDAELVNILRRRIFETVGSKNGRAVASAYVGYYRSPGPRGLLPTNVSDPDLEERIVTHYPFHPRTVALLRDKLGIAPKFMQTRGALLLMMRALRRIWEEDQEPLLIHPHHIDPRDPTIRQELAKRVFDDERLENAIHTELVGNGEPARASHVDQTYQGDLGGRITTTVLLESALVTTRGEKDPLVGATPAEILYEILQAGEDETRAERAVEAVRDTSFHIHPVGEKLVFKGDVNLNRFIEEKERGIRPHRIEEEIRRRLRTHILKGTSIFQLEWWPSSPEEIADLPKVRLAVLPPADPWWLRRPEPNEPVETLFRAKNQGGQPRTFRNAVAFLAPNAEQQDRVEEMVRRFLAVREISQDKEFVGSLSEDQKRILEQERAKSEALATLRVGMAYNLLLYPSAEGEYAKPTLAGMTLSLTEADVGVDSETWRLGKSRVLVTIQNRLADEDKLRSDPYGPNYFVEKIFATRGAESADAKRYGELEDVFFRDTRLPFLATRELVRKTVVTGVEEGTWIVRSGERVFTSKVSAEPILHEDSEVIRYGTERWKEIDEEFCLNCGYRHAECICEVRPPPPPPPPPPSGSKTFRDVWLRDVPGRLDEWAGKQKREVAKVLLHVNKPGDMAFLLRLMGALGAGGTTAEVGGLRVSISSVDDLETETYVQAQRPGALWSLVKGSVEGLLAQLTLGKGQGRAYFNLIVRFREPLRGEALRRALEPLTMAGGENIKLERVEVTAEEAGE